jgi:hypothetical protein
MKPRPYDSPTRYLMDSETNKGEVHLIDLTANDNIGECSCQHYTLKIQPEMESNEAGRKSDPDRYRCKHIKRVREYLFNHVLNSFSQLSQPKPKNDNE